MAFWMRLNSTRCSLSGFAVGRGERGSDLHAERWCIRSYNQTLRDACHER